MPHPHRHLPLARTSLFASGAPERLAVAALLSGGLWIMIAWALA